jgi:hypothetical protein
MLNKSLSKTFNKAQTSRLNKRILKNIDLAREMWKDGITSSDDSVSGEEQIKRVTTREMRP